MGGCFTSLRPVIASACIALAAALLVAGCSHATGALDVAGPGGDLAGALRRAGLPVRSVSARGSGRYHVDLSDSDLEDLTTLRSLPIASLDVHKTRVTDLRPLQDMQLEELILCKSSVSDLGPLRGMPLRTLKCSHTAIRDLSPLEGMSLTVLWIGRSPVADLKPLSGLPLQELFMEDTRVTDVSPLEGMPLERLRFSPTHVTRGIEVIRGMPGLQTINAMRTRAFWKWHDAGRFGGKVPDLEAIRDVLQ